MTQSPVSGKRLVTLIAGDGVGPEVVRAAQRVVEAAGAPVAWQGCEAGAEVFSRGLSSGVPHETIESIRQTRVVLKGPLKVTERVEQDSGRVVSTAKLTGTLKLKNTSVDQSCSASSRTAPSHRTDGSRSGTACRPDHGKASVASAASGKSHRGLSPRRCSRPGPSGTVPSSWGGFPLCSA